MKTKQDILEEILKQEKPTCPQCNIEMSIWEVPEIAVGDGLGWGTPYLFICFNDDCPEYTKGWDNIRDNYAHNASYRCMNYPGTNQFESIPVFSPQGAKGQAVDDDVLIQEQALKEAIKKGFSILATCYTTKDWIEVLKLLLDPIEPMRVRLKAAEMIGDIGDVEAIEPIINHKFPNDKLSKQVLESINKLHERHFTRECPFCAEIIKKRAKICKHCGKDIISK